MGRLSGHTPTELLKMGNDTSALHEKLKNEITLKVGLKKLN